MAASTASEATRSASVNASSAPKRRLSTRAGSGTPEGPCAACPAARTAPPTVAPALTSPPRRPPIASWLAGEKRLAAAAGERAQRALVHLDQRVRQARVVEPVCERLPVVDRPVEEARERESAGRILGVLIDD